MSYTVEIVKLKQAEAPEVLVSFAQSASSARLIREAMKQVMKSRAWPTEADGFRIVSESGHTEFCGWPSLRLGSLRH